MAQHAHASCKEPLPSENLHALDSRTDTDPMGAAMDAQALLRQPGIGDFQRAQLHALIADAYDTMSDDAAARKAAVAGQNILSTLAPVPGVDRLQLRFGLIMANTAQGKAELDAAVTLLDQLAQDVRADSLGQACLLLVRSRVYSRQLQHELAAEDGLHAYALAAQLKADAAQIETAFQLATTFRRAELYEQALRYVDEARTRANALGLKAVHANTVFVQAQVLDSAGRHGEALGVARQARDLSIELRDGVGQAFADHQICISLLALQKPADAATACEAARAGYLAAGRLDQVAGADGFLAKIDAYAGRPKAALARLDQALANDGNKVPPTFLPTLYREQSDALARLGRHREALSALRRSQDLFEAAERRRRSLAAALISAQWAVEQSQRRQQLLSSQLQVARQQAENRELSRRLAIAVAVGVILLAALLAYLLVASRRHAGVLRLQEALLRRTADNSPDALVLLDARGNVRYASRPLFGRGAKPVEGQPLADAGPPEVRSELSAAVARLIEQSLPVELDVRVTTTDMERHFELRGLPIHVNGEIVGATVRASDVTEQRTVERRMVDAASRERLRISSDLHDGLGQELTGISLHLAAIAAAARTGRPVAAAAVEESTAQVARAIVTVRDLARGLSPMHAERGRLSAALFRLAQEATERLRRTVSCSSAPAEISLPDEIAEHLYAVAYEAVTNAARHGGCQSISISLVENAGTIELVIADDGVGMPSRTGDDSGWGLKMMQYRMRLAGGTLRLESSPKGGTRVIARLAR